MILTDAVRERLTDEVLERADNAHFSAEGPDLQACWAAQREVLLTALAPVLEQAQRELDAASVQPPSIEIGGTR